MANSSIPWLSSCLLAAFAAAALTPAGRCQCTNPWLPGASLPGSNGDIQTSLLWDPDGAGPLPQHVVFGGLFTFAGSTAANSIVMWNPTTNVWSPLGGGVNGAVRALAVLGTGELVAGGDFTTAGGVPVASLARWDGNSWSPLGSGVSASNPFWSAVSALAIANGDLIVGGGLSQAGGAPARQIARWNGATWAPLGNGVSGGQVYAIAVAPNGDIIAGGNFSAAGGSIVGGVLVGAVSAQGIARWDGTAWSSLGTFGSSTVVNTLLFQTNGNLAAGGRFTGGPSGATVMEWNGTTWSMVGNGLGSQPADPVLSLAQRPNGNLVAGRRLGGGSLIQLDLVQEWDGTSWSSLGSGIVQQSIDETVDTVLVLPNGDLVAAGRFAAAGGQPTRNVARWNGLNWAATSQGTDGPIFALATLPNGDLVAGGNFSVIGGTQARRVARWNGSTWSALGLGASGPVRALVTRPNGDVVAGGDFSAAGGLLVNGVARWNGTTWQALGLGLNAGTSALAAAANGDLYAGGQFSQSGSVLLEGVAVWNGSTWAQLGFAFLGPGSVHALAVAANGSVIVGGSFRAGGALVDNGIARWTGTVWQLFGSGILGTVRAIHVLPNGDVMAGGQFTTAGGAAANRIARWNGSSWSPLGSGTNGTVLAITSLPNGDVVAAGEFTLAGGIAANRIARWNGVAWSPFGAGLDQPVAALLSRSNAEVVVAGEFLSAGGLPSSYLAQLSTTCPASVVVGGGSCTGSAGPITLTTSRLPWIGTTFASAANGVPTNGLAIGVAGFGITNLPLAAILPQGIPGCSLLVTPDLLTVHLPTANTVTLTLVLPNTPTLVGTIVHQQAVPFAFDAAGNLTAVTASNTLSLTLGAF
ncbi:MAG: hypothetical protein MUC36_12665 [Planctomycetes bacterium]|jgi:hypothetical protein|nr:hypothetical protein [Planctomycetota bacterium]